MSVVIPAHDEESTIGELLTALTSAGDGAGGGCLEIIVAANACTDDTVAVAGRYGPEVTVLDLPEPSKRVAQIAADEVATSYPRAYVDADVVVTRADLLRLAAAVAAPGDHLAAAPERDLDTRGVSWVVRRYYAVWQRLPQVREGLFGRGVVVVSQKGARRLETMPMVLSDDLVMSEAFAPAERVVVRGTRVRIRLPRTAADLVRRRVRVATGNAQADRMGLRSSSATTSVRVLLDLVVERPTSVVGVATFLGVTLVARRAAARRVRAGDFTTWLRDESSRVTT